MIYCCKMRLTASKLFQRVTYHHRMLSYCDLSSKAFLKHKWLYKKMKFMCVSAKHDRQFDGVTNNILKKTSHVSCHNILIIKVYFYIVNIYNMLKSMNYILDGIMLMWSKWLH